ncbi:MAG: hypothetical protein CMO44_15040 [Verrucomicrobiales bacterium]|nr:hypothetical protein [Verrucomicrobiales bacterium]|tara:strand:+ start:5978 stop:6679 length:702 start_codon:yes stop_codon:yes gene_type:complete
MAKRRFRVQGSNYGGELAIGQVSKEFVDYFIDKDESDLIETVTSYEWDDEDMGDKDAPKIAEEFNGWYECDDLEHLNNSYADGEWFVNEVPADGSDDYAWDENEVRFEPYHLYGREAYHQDKDEEGLIPVLCFHSGEKGGFGSYFIETDGEDFDPKKLAFSSVETSVSEIVENVWYNKELIEADFDYNDTTGKGYYASVGYFNPKWHDKDEMYTPEYLKENEYWEGFDEQESD